MISIIIINYKQKKFTINCVRSVYQFIKNYPFEVIVVNNSPEDNLGSLAGEFAGIRIFNNENKGYSQANNYGAKQAAGEYLFFLNADTLLRSDFTKKFITYFEEKEFGAVGLKLYNEDETFQLSFGKKIDFRNEIQNKESEAKFRERESEFMQSMEKEYSGVSEVDWVSGAAMIVKKNNFTGAGGFDEKYFLYYEDADLCQRLREAGMENYFFPYSDIIHMKGENTNPDFDSEIYLYSKKSQIYYYKKHNGLIQNILIRSYLFMKFSIKYLLTFKKINLQIVKASLGLESK